MKRIWLFGLLCVFWAGGSTVGFAFAFVYARFLRRMADPRPLRCERDPYFCREYARPKDTKGNRE